MQLQENTLFANRYQLIKLLGRGGFSEVWLAKDNWTRLQIAIKVYAPGQGMDQDGLQDFCGELASVYDLNHSNLLKPQHVDTWENMPYLIMAYCPSGSCVKRVGKMTEAELWKLIHDVAAGLAYLHEKDIIHQDIKPDNILIDTEGNYLITDFGISTRARSTLRKSVIGGNTSGGTTAYMGPERFSRQPAPTKASDIWSFGAMAFELLEGVTPFGEIGGGMQKGGAEIPFINAPVSYALKYTIFKMLSKETWDRPTAATLVEWASNPSSIEIDYSLLSEEGSSAQTQSVPASVAETPTPQPEGRVTQRFSNAEPVAGVNNTFPSSSKKIDNGPSSNASSEGKPAKKKKSKVWIWLIFGAITLIGLAIFLSSWLEKAEKEQQLKLLDEHITKGEIAAKVSIQGGSIYENKPFTLNFEEYGSGFIAHTIEGAENIVDYDVEEVLSDNIDDINIDDIFVPNKKYNYTEKFVATTNAKYVIVKFYLLMPYGYSDKVLKEFKFEIKRRSIEYVDLGLPSGTLWKNANEGGEATFYNYDEAVSRFSNKLPTTEQLEELKDKCTWIWTTQYGVKGYKVIGPNGNNIFLPAAGYLGCSGFLGSVGTYGFYWSSTPRNSGNAWRLYFSSSEVSMNYSGRCYGRSVRLVQNL